jgi:YegS/Rv2252/BmrU family lipid kinase
MRKIFILNPAAGQGGASDLTQAIKKAAEALGESIELYYTQGIKDAEDYARTVCQGKLPEETVRFYACGGDGTINEVVNGSFGFPNVEIGLVPTGTGNDYVREYNTPEAFLDIEDQLKGTSVLVDVFKYSGLIDGREQSRYCANMMNIGFDANVVYRVSKLKKLPLIGGSLAYLLGIFIELIEKNGTNLKLEFDDGTGYDGKMLLVAIAIGSYCGGGIKCLPMAKANDGLLDVQVIKDATRRLFVHLLPKYMKGTHLDDKRAQKILLYKQMKKLAITPNAGTTWICVDGEMEKAGHLEIEIIPQSIRFIVPDFKKPRA